MLSLIAALHYLGHVFQEPPDAAFLKETASLGAVQGFAELAALLPCFCAGERSPEELGRTAAEDHFRLFSGPDPLAPPWESVWRERDRLLFGEKTAEIAQIYADWGMEIQGEGHNPQDHLGLELGFLAYLMECIQGNVFSNSGMSPLAAARHLLEDHILQFAPHMLKEAERQASSIYYKQMCRNCLIVLDKTATALASI